jgi:hypothetical protein
MLLRTIYEIIQVNFKGNRARRYACASSNICRMAYPITDWSLASDRKRVMGWGEGSWGHIREYRCLKGEITRKYLQDPLYEKTSNSHQSSLLKCNNKDMHAVTTCRCLLGKQILI